MSVFRKRKAWANHASMFGLRSTVLTTMSIGLAGLDSLLERLDPPFRGGEEFDREFGTDTAPIQAPVPPWVEGMPEVNRYELVPYWPMSICGARHILGNLPKHVNPITDFQFIDVGCGKGLMLMLASDLPFRRIVGIELNDEHAKIAETNVASYRGKRGDLRCSNIGIHVANALEFSIPDGSIVLFLFNPFVGSVFSGFLEHVHTSVTMSSSQENGRAERRNREVYLVYSTPLEEEVLEESPFFELVEFYPALKGHFSWGIWRHI